MYVCIYVCMYVCIYLFIYLIIYLSIDFICLFEGLWHPAAGPLPQILEPCAIRPLTGDWWLVMVGK